MPAVQIILGTVILLFGRKLYWVFIALAGFLLGAHLANVLLVDQTVWLRLLVAIGVGAVGALIALLAMRVAFALAGLYAGGYLALLAVESTGGGHNQLLWLVIGGAIGALLAALLMDWAIIVLSSLAGAGAVTAPLGLSPLISLLVLVALVVCGIAFQAHTSGPPAHGHKTSSPAT